MLFIRLTTVIVSNQPFVRFLFSLLIRLTAGASPVLVQGLHTRPCCRSLMTPFAPNPYSSPIGGSIGYSLTETL